MPAIHRPTPLFSDRHEVGEAFCFGRLTRAELVDPVAVAVSAGGVEVAFPYAYLEGGSLHFLPTGFAASPLTTAPGQVRDLRGGAPGPRPGAPRLEGVAGRDVVLFDDGLAPVAALVDAAQAIRRGGPRRFLLAVPLVTPPVRRLFLPRLVDGVVTARNAHRITAGAELYHAPEPATPERARAMIADVLAGDARRIPDLALTDGPQEGAGPHERATARNVHHERSVVDGGARALVDGGARESPLRESPLREIPVPEGLLPESGARALRERTRRSGLPPLARRERDWAAAAWLRLDHADPTRLSGEES